MKSEIKIQNNFRPVKLEIIFESAFELSDFIGRLKADNHLPSSVQGLIRQMEDFEKKLPIDEVFPMPEKNQGIWIVKVMRHRRFMGNDEWKDDPTEAVKFHSPEAAMTGFRKRKNLKTMPFTGWGEGDIEAVML